ncbi:MAG TPA: hypothetical protein VFU27_09945 [Terriglobales bacterium]|nr:hypothetical protein [Terriglobales bacterium]
MASEFRVEQTQFGYRVALYRDGKYDVTFVDGLSRAAANREARSLAIFWQRIQRRSIARPRAPEAGLATRRLP